MLLNLEKEGESGEKERKGKKEKALAISEIPYLVVSYSSGTSDYFIAFRNVFGSRRRCHALREV